MNAPAQDTAHVCEMLREALRWRLLSMLFERPRPGAHAGMRALAVELGDPRLAAVVDEASGAVEGDYLALVGPGGTVRPREVAYRFRSDLGRMLAELAGFYRAFAYEPRSEDPLDHIAVEAGFVAYLYCKEAYAMDRGDAVAEGITRDARRRFTDDHLAGFVDKLAVRLEEAGPGYLAHAARAAVEAAGIALKTPPALRVIAGFDVDEEPAEHGCGGCAES